MKRMPKRTSARRGVLLLVVLSLLVLFALIAITFVLVSSQYRRSSTAAGRAEQTGDDYRRQLDEVFAQVVRDTTNPHSALQQHSLLNDLYGVDGVRGTISAVNTVNSQFIDIVPTTITNLSAFPTATQYQTPGYFNGCVLTMTNGPAANLSARIVGWGFASGTYTIRIMAFDGFNMANFTTTNVGTNSFLINGRPFNGTGFGFNPTSGGIDAKAHVATLPAPTDVPYALLPNGTFFVQLPGAPNTGTYATFGGLGGADDNYDAADPQNMFLAYMSANPTSSADIVPSFHRPDLVTFMQKNATYSPAWTGSNNLVPRQVLMRPLGQTVGVTAPDHPNFTGSNSAGTFNPTTGPWDVDNDGDGIPDSVWIDFGAAVQTAPDGRRFKPMAAILCLDMDGRLNVNAHGSLAQVDSNFAAPGNPFASAAPPLTPATRYIGGPAATSGPIFATGVTTTIPVALGAGYGPADVSLAPLFTTALNYQYLMTGDTSGNQGRYGQIITGNPFQAYPGIYNQESPLGLLKFFEYPVPNYPSGVTNYPNIPNGFGTPPDLWARGFVGLDVRGTPLMPGIGLTFNGSVVNDTLNNPYELNLSRKMARAASSPVSGATGGPDNPFSPGELERILRMYDLDASALPDRLRALIDTGRPLSGLRHIVTTDSFDLPSPGVLAPSEVRANPLYSATSASQTILDLLLLRNPALTSAQIAQLLPNEVIAGLRMDINRPFGNGRDDNNNGVVDDPAEATGELVWPALPTTATAPAVPTSLANFSNAKFDADNDGIPNSATDMYARQVYARHLYVLMTLLLDQNVIANKIDWNNDGDITTDLYETQRGIAQWAINVADFQDRDSIMTPFPYMIDPFHGWTVSNVPQLPSAYVAGATDIVWGCERPELLITETLAFHDRRTEDRNDESFDNSDPSTPSATGQGFTYDIPLTMKDGDFDQRLMPLGSFFVELYNPWTTHSSTLNPDGSSNATGNPSVPDAPGEFYDVATAITNSNPSAVQGVQLNRRAGGAALGSPVWRLLVVKGVQPAAGGLPNLERKDPDDPIMTNRPSFNTPAQLSDDVERSIYFADPGSLITGHGQPYFTSKAVSQLLPGRYAVVGSSGFVDPLNTTPQQRYVTPIGRPTVLPAGGEGNDYSTYRQIALTPGAPGNQVQVLNNGGTEPATTDMQPAIAVVIDQPRSVSISEPTGSTEAYYTTYGTPQALGAETAFSPVLDLPLDVKRLKANATIATDFAALAKDATTVNFRTVHLQRLADPTINWNAVTNPYLTIDTMTVDLTVFTGTWDPAKPRGANDPVAPVVGIAGLASLQRGDPHQGTNDPLTPFVVNNLWHHETPNTAGIATNPDQLTQYYKFFMLHSLGYLNKFPLAALPSPAPSTNAYTSAYTSTSAPGAPASTQYVGVPNGQPFDWLTWNNRPFANPMELMLVPKSRSSKLLYEFVNSLSATGVYTARTPVVPAPASVNPIYGHLLPFFETVTSTGTNPAPNFHRLFEYVQSPSRFVGTETELTPGSFAGALAGEAGVLSFYHPPFNTVSNFRDPGKININTIPSDTNTGASSQVWGGILNGSLAPLWTQIVTSRRGGFASANGFELSLDSITLPTFPSYFSNPFRSSGGAPLSLATLVGKPALRDIDATLMRADPTTPTLPLFSYVSGNNIDNSSRNPYFANQIYQRLANSLTTRSNVYAVWITVGYFEVTPAPPKPSSAPPQPDYTIYPDGYQLGQELGSDSGEIKRHRAFYIYDRSIPVGFELGKDHNIDRGVLLKRFIE